MKHWLNVQEVAKYMGVSKETIYRLIYLKKIPAHRIGKLWIFNQQEIDKAIMDGKLK